MPVLLEEVSTCSACEDDLAHCHGTAIIQLDASYECSDDPDCRLAIEAHLLIAWPEEPAAIERP